MERAIGDAVSRQTDAGIGLLLSIDCPDLAMGPHIKFRDATTPSF